MKVHECSLNVPGGEGQVDGAGGARASEAAAGGAERTECSLNLPECSLSLPEGASNVPEGFRNVPGGEGSGKAAGAPRALKPWWAGKKRLECASM